MRREECLLLLYYRRRTRRILKQVYGKATRKQGNSRGGLGMGGGGGVGWRMRDCCLGRERDERCELRKRVGGDGETLRTKPTQTQRPMLDCLPARGPPKACEKRTKWALTHTSAVAAASSSPSDWPGASTTLQNDALIFAALTARLLPASRNTSDTKHP